MGIRKSIRLNPVFWGILLFIIAQVLILLVASRIDPFLEERNIYVPSQPSETISLWPGEVTSPSGEITEVPAQSSLGPVLIYIFASVAVVGLTLSLIPLKALRLFLRILFALLFSWGAFIVAVFYLPLPVAITLAVLFGAFWFAIPLIWLHDMALILALISLGAVFGRFITPWTVMILILLLALYDFLAVRFGFMLWMADRLSQINALPALIVPKDYSQWSLNLRKHGEKIIEANAAERGFSVLGGGDIAFPCLLTASVYFSQGLAPGVTIAAFGSLGLVSAYTIQATLLKGKPIPALPPIAALALVGLLIIS
jgi:presenilin-like A22 family membrane protease